jgi:predicted ATP-grasp superfamily ATP-dependent carboligase
VAVVLDFGAASPLNILAAARRLCDVVFVCDADLPFVRAQLDDLAAFGTVCDVTGLSAKEAARQVGRLAADAITTFSEARVAATAALAAECGLRFHSPRTALALTDKLTQRRALAAAGVQSTRCQAVTGQPELAAAVRQVGLPAVLKPRSGAGGARTCRVETAGEAAARLAEFLADPGGGGAHPGGGRAGFVLEELLAGDPAAAGPRWGDYVSVESVTRSGVTTHLEVTGKFPLTPPFRETGYVVPATLEPALREAVLGLTAAALAALGVTGGMTHTEVKLTPAGPRIIEVNGRLGGYVAGIIRRARGFDLVRVTLAASLDVPAATALGLAAAQPLPGYLRHAFQYFVLPPMGAVRLHRLAGADELRRQPGVQLVEVFKQAGDELDWREGTLSYLGIVHGSGHGHDDVLRLAELARQTLRIEYETQEGHLVTAP